MEIGTLRAILRKARLWANIQPDIRMLRVRDEVGRALSDDEQHRLLTACRASRSRSLYPAVLLSLHTGLRNQELRLLRWRQIDLIDRKLIVGKIENSWRPRPPDSTERNRISILARLAEQLSRCNSGSLRLPFRAIRSRWRERVQQRNGGSLFSPTRRCYRLLEGCMDCRSSEGGRRLQVA